MGMETISKTFSATGTAPAMHIKKGQEILYSITLSSDWDGTVQLRRTKDGGHTEEIITTITTAQDTGSILTEAEGNYFWFCTVFTAGTAVALLNNLSTDNLALPGAGFPEGATVSVLEKGDGDGVVHKTIIKLESTPVTVVSVTTGAGVGGTTVYNMPQGRILIHGTQSQLAYNIATADEADFTDGTPEGDVAVGTLAPANADGLGTDATDDNLGTAGAFTMANFTASVNIVSEAALQFDGTTTAMNVVVNMLVDAGDIDDDTTTTVYVSGNIIITWSNLGDF